MNTCYPLRKGKDHKGDPEIIRTATPTIGSEFMGVDEMAGVC